MGNPNVLETGTSSLLQLDDSRSVPPTPTEVVAFDLTLSKVKAITLTSLLQNSEMVSLLKRNPFDPSSGIPTSEFLAIAIEHTNDKEMFERTDD